MIKTYNISKRISKNAREAINNIIDTHEKYRNSYFFSPSYLSSCRRTNEQKFAKQHPPINFIRDNEIIAVRMLYQETCKNVYYKLYIKSIKDNVITNKNILYLKKIINK